MKRIAFPTDFSDTSKNALQFTLALAKDLNAAVDVFTVYHLPMTDAGHVPYEMLQRMTDEQRESIEQKLSDLEQEFGCDEFAGCHAVYGMFVPNEINDFIEEHNSDIVIMGTKSDHDRFERILGSISTNTMMSAKVPVIAVPAGAAYKGIKQIAYATDFSKNDTHQLAQLLDFSKLLRAKTNFVHVETRPQIGLMNEELTLKNHPLPFSEFTIINEPSVIEGLDRYVEEQEVDLLAMFIPKRRLWEKLFHKSMTRMMTFHTKLPLLVFHE